MRVQEPLPPWVTGKPPLGGLGPALGSAPLSQGPTCIYSPPIFSQALPARRTPSTISLPDLGG